MTETKGTWVKHEDMTPETNIWGRRYRTKPGEVLTYYGYPTSGFEPVEWFFPQEYHGRAHVWWDCPAPLTD